jgi:hypothetical protein
MKINITEHESDDDVQCPKSTKCEACGHEWFDPFYDDDSPMKCGKCGHIPELKIIGIGSLSVEQLGKELGKYSWCSICEDITLNVLGKTYCNKPFLGQTLISNHKEPEKDFFGCEKCGNEKFWRWEYSCPQCDCGDHYTIEIAESQFNYGASMGVGGDTRSWEELWKCKVCGLEYWINNSNY